MHDRRVDGKTRIFGNQGALYNNAMTWFDHRTQSVWSQPWGTAIAGPLQGTALTLIPASVVPWSTWLAQHPDTTVVFNDLKKAFPPALQSDEFVIGVALQDAATAYDYQLASRRRVVNDSIGGHPIVVFVDPDTRDIKVYLRRVSTPLADESAPAELRFVVDHSGRVTDTETGSEWDTAHGVATEGSLKGTILQSIPYVTSFDWAWKDFFPHTAFYDGEET